MPSTKISRFQQQNKRFGKIVVVKLFL